MLNSDGTSAALKPIYIDGKQFTEVATKEGEHKSNWDDAVVIHVAWTPVNQFMLKRYGEKHAR